MNTLQEILKKGDDFAKITAYNMSTNILDRFIEENNGRTKVSGGAVIQWCEYNGDLITFTYPEGYKDMDLHAFGQYNKFSLRVNTVICSLRLIDIASTFGKYIDDLEEQYQQFLKVLAIKIEIASFSRED